MRSPQRLHPARHVSSPGWSAPAFSACCCAASCRGAIPPRMPSSPPRAWRCNWSPAAPKANPCARWPCRATTPSSLNATPACSPLCWTNALTARPAARGWSVFGRAARGRPLAAHRPAGPRPAALCADARTRQRAAEHASARPPHPAGRERTQPAPTAAASADTIAVLGAGLNLGWLAAPWLQERSLAYWGDLDTWGLRMLATARHHLPHLHALLMYRRHLYRAHQHLAMAEPVHAPEPISRRTDARRSRHCKRTCARANQRTARAGSPRPQTPYTALCEPGVSATTMAWPENLFKCCARLRQAQPEPDVASSKIRLNLFQKTQPIAPITPCAPPSPSLT